MRVFVLAGAEQEQDPFDLSMPNETRKTFTYSALTSSEHFPCPSPHPRSVRNGSDIFRDLVLCISSSNSEYNPSFITERLLSKR